MSSAVSTSGVTKRYGPVTALDAVDLTVPSGSIYGLVGPNGAGKTTLLGILAGLRKPSSGTITISARTIGVLPDTPQYDGWLTGREVVELSRRLADNGTPAGAVDEVLGTAGLSEAADRRVKGYSRGMLQRLGLAAAVVNQPELLLFDEPAAALDPAGRREVLNLVSALRGRSTVLFSSHILDDVQEVCDEVGILRRGELVYQGSLAGLLAGRTENQYVVHLRSGHAPVARAIRNEVWVDEVKEVDGGRLVVTVHDLEEAERSLVALLGAAGHPVVSVMPRATSLEDVFLEVTR